MLRLSAFVRRILGGTPRPDGEPREPSVRARPKTKIPGAVVVSARKYAQDPEWALKKARKGQVVVVRGEREDIQRIIGGRDGRHTQKDVRTELEEFRRSSSGRGLATGRAPQDVSS